MNMRFLTVISCLFLLIGCSSKDGIVKPTDNTAPKILEIREGYGVDSLLVEQDGELIWLVNEYIPNPNYEPVYPSLEYERMKEEYLKEHEEE